MNCFRLIQTVAMFSLLLSMMLAWPQLNFAGSQVEAVAVQDDRSAEVNALIRELRDPKFVVRETASRKLVEIGTPAVAALKLAAKSDSLEVQVRAKSILSIIQLDFSSNLNVSEQAIVKQFVASDGPERVAILKQQASNRNVQLFLELLDICVADEEQAVLSEGRVESAIEELIGIEEDNPVAQWVGNLLRTQRWEELDMLVSHPGVLKYSPILRASVARNAGNFEAYVEDRYQWFSKAQATQESLATRELISLIGLLRVQRDFDRAKKVIAVLPDVDLQQRLNKDLLFQQGDWNEILRRANLDPAAPDFILTNPLQQALLHHLLGHEAGIADIEQELRQQLQAVVEAAGEENTDAAKLLTGQLRILGAVTLNWPLVQEYFDKDRIVSNVDMMVALNRNAEALELLEVGPSFKDRRTWMENTLKELNEAQEALQKSGGRRSQSYSLLSQRVEDKQDRLAAVVGMVEQWGLDDEAQLYCQMIVSEGDPSGSAANLSPRGQVEVLQRLAELGRTEEYWQLAESLIRSAGYREYSGRVSFGIIDSNIGSYAGQWASRIRNQIADPVDEAKTIAAIVNSPLLDREGMDFDLEYEMARFRTQATIDSGGVDEFLMGKVFELHGQDEAADSLLKQAAQRGNSLAIRNQFFQAMASEDLYGILKYWLGGRSEGADLCLLAEEAALKILETETDPEKIRLVKNQLELCHLAIAAQWFGGKSRVLGQLENASKSRLAILRLQCLVYGVSGDVADKEGLHRHLGNALLAEGSDAKQQGAIELATLMFDELSYAMGARSDIGWSYSAKYLNIALGKGMIESKEYDRAVDFLVRTAEFSLGDVSVGEDTIKVMAEAGAVKEADQVYQALRKYYVETLQEFPDSPLARNNFAWLSAISNRDLESARRHASVAVKVRPNVENYWDTFAEIEFLLGNPKQAFESSRRCIQLSPERFYYRKQKERFRRAMSEAE